MQATDLSLPLAEAAAEVLETMCFMAAAAPQDAAPEPDQSWMAATLQFRGAASGSFGVRAPAGIARAMTMNFLGEREDPAEERVAEVLGEVTNMICGSALQQIAGDGACDLSQPAPDPADAIPAGAVSRALRLEEGTLLVWIRLEAQP
jgi:CheY-specific phosphatase CheX